MDFEAAQAGGALLSKSVCTSLATRSFSDTASNLTAKKKDEKCCTCSLDILQRQSLFAQSWRCASYQTIPRPLWWITWQTNVFEEKGRYQRGAQNLFHSPEFWVPDAYRAKVKTSLEFVVSAVRANGANVTDAIPLARQLQNMGMPLYGMQRRRATP